jgi:hypothetical protein
MSHGTRLACGVNIHNPNNATLCSPLANVAMDQAVLGSKCNVPAAPVTVCHDQRRQFASASMRCHECDISIEILMRSVAVSHMRQEYHWISAILFSVGKMSVSLGQGFLVELVPLVADFHLFHSPAPTLALI